jgi:hypothetical protein
MDTNEVVAEITDNIDYLKLGTVLGLAGEHGETVRIRFNTVEDAAGWVRDYAKPDQAVFETYPITLADPVVIRLPLSAYDLGE